MVSMAYASGLLNRETFQESPWPGRAPFALVLTHDVDRVRKTYQYVSHLRTPRGWRQLGSLFAGGRPYWNFDRILRLEQSFGVKSSFYFLQESRHFRYSSPREWAVSLGKYRFDDEQVASVIQTLDQRGWEVGLHGSFESFRNEELLRKEKRDLEDVLGREVEGIRQHYLNLIIPKTWQHQANVGFRYDSSLGFRDRVGYGGLPKFPLSPFRDTFLVLPLTVMDGALFQSERTEEKACDVLRGVLKDAIASHALVVVLWHQRFLNPREFPVEYNTYRFLLEFATQHRAWIATAAEATKWWRNQGLDIG